MSRQTPSARLLARLRAMGVPVGDDAAIERTYAGLAMRRSGAWVWRTGPFGDQHVMVGSIYPVTDLIRRSRLCAVLELSAPEWSIWPYNEHRKASDHFLIEPERSTR